MQVSPWANAQCLQDGQRSPHLSHNTRSKHGFRNNTSNFVHQNTGAGGLVGHYTLYNVLRPEQSAGRQRPNKTNLSTNSAQILLNTAYIPVAQLAQFQQPSTVSNNVMHYYPQGIVQNGLNKNSQMPNPTSSSSTQGVYVTQQPANLLNQNASQSQKCSQLPSYSAAVFQNGRTMYGNSNRHNAQNISNNTPLSATSCVNLAATNNQSEKNNYLLSQKNEIHAAQTVNKNMSLLTQMLMSKNTSNSLIAACLQTQTNSHQNQEHWQQPTARGSGDLQTVSNFPPVTFTANGNICSGPSVMLSSQTSLPESTTATSGFQNIRTLPPQTNTPTKDQVMSTLYQKMNYRNQCASMSQSSDIGSVSQVSQVNRYEAFDKIDTVSVFQANGGSIHTSPGRVQRAVAVVPPLAQESPSSELATPNSQPFVKPVSSPNQLETLTIAISDTTCTMKIPQILVQKAGNVQATSPPPKQTAPDLYNGTKHNAMSQSCSPAIEASVNAKLSKRRRSSSANRKTPTEQNPCEKALSSVPTTDWTLDKLCVMIQDMEKNDKNNHLENEFAHQIMHRYLEAKGKAVINAWYTKLMTQVNKFCSDIDLNGVILTQIKSVNNLSAKYCVLQHGEVYQEKSSYTSAWLNNNSQLDDIEKQFGFPWFLKYQECGSSSDSMSGETNSKLKDESQAELGSGQSGQDKALCQDASDQCASKNQPHGYSEDDSSCTFKIEILPPDEAKAIFEHAQCNSPQRVDTSHSEGSSKNSDKPENISKKENSTIEIVCCIEKWKEKVFGLSSESKCQCQELNQGQSDDKSETDFIVDLPKNDSTPVFAIEEEENIQESQNNKFIVISESEDDSQLSYPTGHEDDLGDLLEHAESHTVGSTNKNQLDDCNVTTSDGLLVEEVCRMVHEETPEEKEDESNSATPASPTLVSPSDEPQEVNTKLQVDGHNLLSQQNSPKIKLPAHLKSQTIFESFSKSKSNVRHVQLLLFGSAQQEKCSSLSTRRSHLLSLESFPEKALPPPRRIYVKMSPSKRISEPDYLGRNSVKRRIHENWRKSFPPTTIKLRRKKKKFNVISPAKTNSHQEKDIQVNSKRKVSDAGDNKCHKRKRSRCDRKLEQSDYVQDFKKPVNDELLPQQENTLKFNVLPSTFSFKGGSNNSDCMTDTATDAKSVSPKAKDKKPAEKTQGTWCGDSRKNYPLRSASVSETKNVFQEFQKRYKMMSQTTIDE